MAKEKVCKNCGKELNKKAVICTECGSKVKAPLYKKWWFWVAVVFVLIAIANSGSNDTSTPSNNTTANVQTPPKAEEVIYNIGDTITTDKFSITIKSVESKYSVGGQYFSKNASAGGTYVAVVWEYKNITDKPIASYSCPSIRLADSNNTKYDNDISASSYYATEVKIDSKILSDLNPGITVTDADVFEISEEMYNNGGFTLLIDADKDIKVKVN